MSQPKRGNGCVIALGIAGVLGLVCAAFLAWAGWTVWHSPSVQRGMSILGAVVDLTRDAMNAPGTREMRAAGCTQAMAFDPALMRRFIEAVEPDAGAAEHLPGIPMIFCAVTRSAGAVPSCEDAVRAYGGAVSPSPAEIAAQVTVQGEQAPRCQGVYGADGALLRPMDDRMQHSFGQVGRSASGPK